LGKDAFEKIQKHQIKIEFGRLVAIKSSGAAPIAGRGT
jgi:hypothetical protein